MKKWVYVGYVRAHTHDVRALTMAVPISLEGMIILSSVLVTLVLFMCSFLVTIILPFP